MGGDVETVLICLILLLTAPGQMWAASESAAPPVGSPIATAALQDTAPKSDSGAAEPDVAGTPDPGVDWMYHPDDASSASGDDQSDFSLTALLLKVGLGLGFVVLLAWGSAFLLKKSPMGRELSTMGSGIRILERKYLAPKRAIYLVEMGNRTLALGVTEQSIAVLSRWRAGELEIPKGDASNGGFAAQFRAILGHPNQVQVGGEGDPR